MPKQKSHSGAKKRFKVTGSGKIMKQGAGTVSYTHLTLPTTPYV